MIETCAGFSLPTQSMSVFGGDDDWLLAPFLSAQNDILTVFNS